MDEIKGSDPFKAMRQSLFGEPSVTLEGVIYNPKDVKHSIKKVRIYIRMFFRDEHGILNKTVMIQNNANPAHVHIFDTDRVTEIGRFNITGLHPENISDIEARIIENKGITSYKKDLLVWANAKKDDTTWWDYTQKFWEDNVKGD
jgi:hypothetical protein